jgi:hypothetical protein
MIEPVRAPMVQGLRCEAMRCALGGELGKHTVGAAKSAMGSVVIGLGYFVDLLRMSLEL